MNSPDAKNSAPPLAARPRWSQRGLSLLDVLLASTIIAVGTIATARLMAQSQHFSLSGRDTFIASNLTREGLELVRAVRDTNWFLARGDGRHWTTGLCDPGSDSSFTGQREFTLDATQARRLEPVGDIAHADLFLTDAGEWTHRPTSQKTRFRRRVSVDCQFKNGNPNHAKNTESITVTATVAWQQDEKDRSLVIKEILYNWLPPGASS